MHFLFVFVYFIYESYAFAQPAAIDLALISFPLLIVVVA